MGWRILLGDRAKYCTSTTISDRIVFLDAGVVAKKDHPPHCWIIQCTIVRADSCAWPAAKNTSLRHEPEHQNGSTAEPPLAAGNTGDRALGIFQPFAEARSLGRIRRFRDDRDAYPPRL